MKKFILLLTVFISLLLAVPAGAQAQEFRLSVRKSVGYDNGSQIRGSFRLSILGPQEQIRAVTFIMDEQEMAVVQSAPFEFSFDTNSYPAGTHQLSALVQTTDGSSVRTAVREFKFVTPEEESAGMRNLMVPLLGVLGALMIAMLLSQVLLMRNRRPLEMAPGTPRKYGFKGGSICPRCGRPFSLHWWSINLGLGVYDRCDFCGKWAVHRSRSRADLAAAEAAELKTLGKTPSAPEKSEEEKLRDLLDESKYTRH